MRKGEVEPKLWAERPSWRLKRAMERLSRDKWLPPSEVERIIKALRKCCAGKHGRVIEAAVPIECFCVGMIKGNPPVWRYHPAYPFILYAIKSKKIKAGFKGELKLLNMIIKARK